MVFSSNIFLFAFLPLTLFFYFLLPKKLATKNVRNAILLIASLLFYAWGEMHYLWLLGFSIAANYFFGILIHKKSRNFFITIAVIFNLALLGYFKYSNFLIENLNQFFSLQIANKKISLPIGISFFTFHAISYLIDIYRRKCRPQKNIFDLALYIAFFPQLIAGPIVRYNFIEKYLTKRSHNFFATTYGIRRFIIGLGKKIIIANPLGEFADVIFSSPLIEINSPLAWAGLVCYTLQIYFDFSGYCDMAVGLARIFGFKFPENFNYPYISRSIKEFCRRWHKPIFSENKNKNLPIIFTYKDSYFADLIPLVSEHFSQSFYINEFPCDLDFSILQKRRPNVVIQEFWEGRVEVVLRKCKPSF